MVDVGFLEQLIESMQDATIKLEEAVKNNDKEQANKLKTFIFDLHEQVGRTIGRKNV